MIGLGRDYLNDRIEKIERRLKEMDEARLMLKGELRALHEAVAYLNAQPVQPAGVALDAVGRLGKRE